MASDKPKPTPPNLAYLDDDLDELDDVLEQFTPASKTGPPPHSPLTSPPPPPPTATTTTTFQRPRTNTRVDAPPISMPGSGVKTGLDATAEIDEEELSAEFSRELAKGMESLMREIGGGDAVGTEGQTDEEAQRAFKAAWEAMLVEGMDGMKGSDLAGLEEFMGQDQGKIAGGTSAPPVASDSTNDFQNKIKQAMEKLKASESNLQDSQTGGSSNPLGGADPESLEALLASLGDMGLGEGGEGDAELAGLLENMMSQLVSKEILYDPLKELADGMPPYLANPPAPISSVDRTRYESQLACIHKIMAVFDDPSYREKDPASMKVISDLMNEMQNYGAPPAEVMGPLPPGMGLGPDGMPQMGNDCVIA
ncbi:Pex19 protein family-domain-containing protein [Collybia nuda]|uniref:Pex19 protein family-domain-containing protein n=1 Tax=Collybia nuda TaxID=64659 RepID=A0A9P5Y155_9AGAR|nr:Pex19 protein family-domain-containing protein [Collybia nuda]